MGKNVKAVGYELIAPDSEDGLKVYGMVRELVELYHEDLRDARIAVAFNLNWRPDVDGRLTVGKIKRATDLDRELASFDLVLIVLRRFWNDDETTDAQRRALLDHELQHATLALDSDLEPIEDERGRKQYRLRKHDIEEFSAVVERHGLYKKDLERFAKSIMKSKQGSLFDQGAAETEAESEDDDEPRKYPLAVESRIAARAD